MNTPSHALRWRLLGTWLFSLSVGAVGAQNPSVKDKDATQSSAIKLPSGAIIVVTNSSETIDRPDAIYLSPEKFREMNDQIEQLKRQLLVEKPVPPSSCELEGRVEQRGSQSIVRIKASFKFRTIAQRSIVFLGCKKAQPVEAKMGDGKLPFLASTEKGLTVQVESPGEHSVLLVLELPLLSRGPKGNEIGCELGLPGAPITTLNFEAPSAASRISVGRREATMGAPPTTELPPDFRRFDAKHLAPGQPGEALGPVTQLTVSWEKEEKEPGGPGGGDNTRSAESEVQVTIGESEILAETRLALKGSVKQWRFVAPSNAEVTVGRLPGAGSSGKPIELPVDQAPDVIRPEPGKTEWRIGFRETNSAELLVVISSRMPRNRDPKGRTSFPVGPFAALDTPQQSGLIRVKSLPHLRAAASLKGDTQRVDGADDPGAEAIYRFRSFALGPNNQPAPPMVLDISAMAGTVQTRVQHFLSRDAGDGGWRLRAEILVTPIRSEIESLDLEVPAAAQFEVSPPRLVEGIVPLRDNGPQRRVIQVKLAAPQRAEFSITLEGFYSLPPGIQEATLVLPRLLNVFDRSDQVTVSVPEGFDLIGGAYQWEKDKPGKQMYPLEASTAPDRSGTVSASVNRSIAFVQMSWKPQRSDIRVDALIDMRLGDRQAQVTHQLHYAFADRAQKKLRLHAPAAATSVTVNTGSIEVGPGYWYVNLAGDPVKETTFTLTYNFPLAATGAEEPARVTVPLAWPEGVTACESRLRILRDRAAINHLLPALDSDLWQELPTEIVPGEAALPLLVLRATGVSIPLTLTLQDAGSGAPSMPNIWIDRALIQAQLSDQGQQYRVRFHLSKWQARTLDLDLPAAAAELESRIGGLRSDARIASGDTGTGYLVRLSLPAWREPQQLLIEVKYKLPAGRSDGIDAWITRWQPPKPRGRVAIASVRWQVAIPGRFTPLSIGDATFEERWVVPNGFAHPVAAYTTNELERWLSQGPEPFRSETQLGWDMSDAGVTARQAGLGQFRIVAVPRTAWLFAVSLTVLVTGLLLSRLPRRGLAVVVALMAGVALVIGFLWPQPMGQLLAAAQPGLLLLFFFLGFQRLLHWRYRRRLARMPGFSRIHSGSAIARVNGKGGSRETSTIDSPVNM